MHGGHPHKLKENKHPIDKFIYIAVIIGPIMNLPQLFKIFYYQDASGVSFVSWLSFSIISLIWLVYGIVHKNKPILIMNFFLMIIQALIAIGAIMYGSGF